MVGVIGVQRYRGSLLSMEVAPAREAGRPHGRRGRCGIEEDPEVRLFYAVYSSFVC